MSVLLEHNTHIALENFDLGLVSRLKGSVQNSFYPYFFTYPQPQRLLKAAIINILL